MAWWIFQNLLSTAALAVLVAALCRFTRIGPVARHALWVLVLVKFVTPPLVVWPWAAPDPFGLGSARSVATVAATPDLDVVPEPITPGSPRGGETRLDVAASPTPISVWPWIAGLWIAGSVVVLGIELVRLSRMARRVRTTRSVDPAISRRAAELSAQLGLRPIPIVGIAGRDAPAVWGFGKPQLLWPAELAADASDACIDGLLLHELAHIKRRDHLVGWIELAAGVAWWWNPVFWQVRSALREQAELACDAWVIASLPNGRRAYAESLLTLSGPEVRGVPPVAVMGMRAGSRRVLERRLVMIMKGRAPVRLPRAGALSLGLLALTTLPAWATSSQQTQVATTVQEPKVVIAPVQEPSKTYTLTVKGQPPKIVDVQAKPKVATTEIKTAIRNGVKVQVPVKEHMVWATRPSSLPEDGQQLIKGFEAERDAIQAEADKKIADRRDAIAKSLQALQDKYAREGKLDEAVAIRDYLRAGMPGLDGKAVWIRR